MQLVDFQKAILVPDQYVGKVIESTPVRWAIDNLNVEFDYTEENQYYSLLDYGIEITIEAVDRNVRLQSIYYLPNGSNYPSEKTFSNLHLSNYQWPLPFGIRPNSSSKEIEAQFGPPVRRTTAQTDPLFGDIPDGARYIVANNCDLFIYYVDGVAYSIRASEREERFHGPG
jgi:hypothetical protein